MNCNTILLFYILISIYNEHQKPHTSIDTSVFNLNNFSIWYIYEQRQCKLLNRDSLMQFFIPSFHFRSSNSKLRKGKHIIYDAKFSKFRRAHAIFGKILPSPSSFVVYLFYRWNWIHCQHQIRNILTQSSSLTLVKTNNKYSSSTIFFFFLHLFIEKNNIY